MRGRSGNLLATEECNWLDYSLRDKFWGRRFDSKLQKGPSPSGVEWMVTVPGNEVVLRSEKKMKKKTMEKKNNRNASNGPEPTKNESDKQADRHWSHNDWVFPVYLLDFIAFYYHCLTFSTSRYAFSLIVYSFRTLLSVYLFSATFYTIGLLVRSIWQYRFCTRFFLL